MIELIQNHIAQYQAKIAEEKIQQARFRAWADNKRDQILELLSGFESLGYPNFSISPGGCAIVYHPNPDENWVVAYIHFEQHNPGPNHIFMMSIDANRSMTKECNIIVASNYKDQQHWLSALTKFLVEILEPSYE